MDQKNRMGIETKKEKQVNEKKQTMIKPLE